MQDVMDPVPSMVHSVTLLPVLPFPVLVRYAMFPDMARPDGASKFQVPDVKVGTAHEVMDPVPSMVHCVTTLLPTLDTYAMLFRRTIPLGPFMFQGPVIVGTAHVVILPAVMVHCATSLLAALAT